MNSKDDTKLIIELAYEDFKRSALDKAKIAKLYIAIENSSAQAVLEIVGESQYEPEFRNIVLLHRKLFFSNGIMIRYVNERPFGEVGLYFHRFIIAFHNTEELPLEFRNIRRIGYLYTGVIMTLLPEFMFIFRTLTFASTDEFLEKRLFVVYPRYLILLEVLLTERGVVEPTMSEILDSFFPMFRIVDQKSFTAFLPILGMFIRVLQDYVQINSEYGIKRLENLESLCSSSIFKNFQELHQLVRNIKENVKIDRLELLQIDLKKNDQRIKAVLGTQLDIPLSTIVSENNVAELKLTINELIRILQSPYSFKLMETDARIIIIEYSKLIKMLFESSYKALGKLLLAPLLSVFLGCESEYFDILEHIVIPNYTKESLGIAVYLELNHEHRALIERTT